MGLADLLSANIPQLQLLAALQAKQNTPDVPQHKGLFGMKGTIRDVIGTVGDALMMANDMNPLYFETRRGEKISDAMGGYSNDPLAAIRSISQYDPALGQKYLNSYLESVAASQKNATTAQATAATNADRDRRYALDAGVKFNPVAAGYIQSANEKTWPAVRERVLKGYSNLGITPPYDLPEKWDEGIPQTWRSYAIPSATEYNAEQSMARTKVSTQAANSRNAARITSTEAGRETPKKIGEYTREDGKKVVMFSDGTEVESTGTVQPTGTKKGPGRAGGPKPGTIQQGYRFKGGDPAKKENWEKVN